MKKSAQRIVNSTSIYWLPTLYFVLHSVEELLFDFPGWATSHFGTTTYPFFIYHHILLFIGLLLSANLARKPTEKNIWRVVTSAWQIQFAINGAFHLASTFIFKEYAPGVITGTIIIWPLTYYFFKQSRHKKLINTSQLRWSLLIGICIAAVVVASLWLDGNIGWPQL